MVAFGLWGAVTAPESMRPRGVALSRTALYAPADTFTCLDGSLTLPYSHLNDDYCDCRDGTDEPGTPACLNGVFHCLNAGHVPQVIRFIFVLYYR
jgi:protein kinase C substrate 80K-H